MNSSALSYPRTILVLCLTLTLTVSAWARDYLPKTVVRSWQLSHPLALADSQNVDTSFINFPMRDALYTYSPLNQWNGNLVSPVQSALYFYRTHKTTDLFSSVYDPYTITPQDVRFYNTTTPFSHIAYKKGFTTYHEDNDLSAFFTGNINRRSNLGAEINYIDAYGHYKSQSGKTVNGSLFGSYNGDHYSLQAAFTFNTLSHFENGGIKDPSDLQNQTLRTEDIPVNLEAMSGYRYLSGYINHYYSICRQRQDSVHQRYKDSEGKWQERDTIHVAFIPLLTFRHVFETHDATRRYLEHSPQTNFYPFSYISQASTRDTTGTLSILNTLSATFEEAYNSKLRFGITAYAYNEFQRHMMNNIPPYPIDADVYFSATSLPIGIEKQSDWRESLQWSNSTFVGGTIHKRTGRYIRYQAGGDVCLVGRKIGEFHVDGDVRTIFPIGKDSLSLSVVAQLRNETPDYFLCHFRSNHYVWDNEFDRTYRFVVGGKVAYPTKWVALSAKVDYENISRLIYFENMDAPKQTEQNIGVLDVDIHVDVLTPWVNLDNHVIYQHSSSYLLPVPTITLYHNLYYHGTWFRALDTQIGVDLSYFTRYYAPILNPAIGQFTIQQNTKVGNFPIISAYANFYVSRIHLRFFAQYQHFNATFMQCNYFSMPNYPLNPDVFRAGLAFHFYN